jgi:hypothetical protein
MIDGEYPFGIFQLKLINEIGLTNYKCNSATVKIIKNFFINL